MGYRDLVFTIEVSDSHNAAFSSQSVRVPLFLACNCGKQGDRKGVEVKLFQDAIDEFGPIAAVVDPVECIVCSVHRYCWHIEVLAIWRSSGDTRSDANTDVVEPAQFLHHSVDLLCTCSLRAKDSLRTIEDDQNFP